MFRELRGRSRTYVLEYDFARYFASLNHSYLLRTLRDFFDVSRDEGRLIETLLRAPFAQSHSDYEAGHFTTPHRGIPQGSCISLFLANAACYELDRDIERLGARFARFADDTVVLCDSYDVAHRCADLIMGHGDRSGVSINFDKSRGISLLTDHPVHLHEMNGQAHVDFLGHRITRDGVHLAETSVSRIKQQVSKIIYQSLLLYPRRHEISSRRIERGVDWDLVSCIYRLRTYLYGFGITEETIDDALRGIGPAVVAPSAFSYFPNTDASAKEVLRGLDGWLVSVLRRAYRERRSLLAEKGIETPTLSTAMLKSGQWLPTWIADMDVTIPSTVRAWRYTKKCVRRFGLRRFPAPTSGPLPDELVDLDRTDIEDPT